MTIGVEAKSPRPSLLTLLQGWGAPLSPPLERFWGKEQTRLHGMWVHENEVWKEQPGCWVAGADEVGRGPLAGPLVAAAVATREPLLVPGLNDSKKLSPRERELIAEQLMACDIRYKITFISVDEISDGNLHILSLAAMERSLRSTRVHPALVLLDGCHRMKTEDYPQRPVVGGDALCGCIAAASILAKVARDKLMVEMDALYPGYGFAQNKGYATSDHLDALRTLGPSPIHRRNFAPVKKQTNYQLGLFEKPETDKPKRSRSTRAGAPAAIGRTLILEADKPKRGRRAPAEAPTAKSRQSGTANPTVLLEPPKPKRTRASRIQAPAAEG